jgi:type IV pilus assembly protein PilV
MKMKTKMNTQRGAMLIEVLVAMLLSAVALLALASANAATLRYTKMSQYRTLATLLATDIGERMRANKAGFAARAYDYSANFAAQSAAPSMPAQLCASAASVCTAGDIAALDLAQWRVQARNLLPQGAVFLLMQADAVAADVWLAWRDPLLAGPDEAPALSTECPAGLSANEAGIRCSYFRIKL